MVWFFHRLKEVPPHPLAVLDYSRTCFAEWAIFRSPLIEFYPDVWKVNDGYQNRFQSRKTSITTNQERPNHRDNMHIRVSFSNRLNPSLRCSASCSHLLD